MKETPLIMRCHRINISHGVLSASQKNCTAPLLRNFALPNRQLDMLSNAANDHSPSILWETPVRDLINRCTVTTSAPFPSCFPRLLRCEEDLFQFFEVQGEGGEDKFVLLSLGAWFGSEEVKNARPFRATLHWLDGSECEVNLDCTSRSAPNSASSSMSRYSRSARGALAGSICVAFRSSFRCRILLGRVRCDKTGIDRHPLPADQSFGDEPCDGRLDAT